MPKETEKVKKVTGTNIRGEAECAREGITQLPLIPVKRVATRECGNSVKISLRGLAVTKLCVETRMLCKVIMMC